MQVYVSKGGKQYGPYAVDQLRQLVEAGNFAHTDHACHDGANWTTIAGVPGFAQTTEPLPYPDVNPSMHSHQLVRCGLY